MRTSISRIRYGSIFLKYPDDTPMSTPMESEKNDPGGSGQAGPGSEHYPAEDVPPEIVGPEMAGSVRERSLSTGFIS